MGEKRLLLIADKDSTKTYIYQNSVQTGEWAPKTALDIQANDIAVCEGKVYLGGTIGSFTGVIAYDVDTDSTVGATSGYSYIHLQDPVAGNISLAVTSLGESFDGVEEHKVSISYSYTQSRVDLMEYTVWVSACSAKFVLQ